MDRTEWLASENLINCFVREGGIAQVSGNTLAVSLPLQKKILTVDFDRRLQLGDVRIRGPVYLEGQPLNAEKLAETLGTEMGHGIPLPLSRPSDWKVNFLSSLEVNRRILGGSDRTPVLSGFESSEQSLICGHRFHPSPKSRVGWSDEDVRLYSPEFGACFQLHYFKMSKAENFVSGKNEFLARWEELTGRCSNGQVLLPVHPWQAQSALKNEQFQKALRDGRIQDLGVGGAKFSATSSVRTLYQREWDLFLKTSLSVRVTNCFRLNLQPEMRAAQMIDHFLEQNTLDTDSFRILREPLGLDVNAELGVNLGVIFRTGLGEDRGALLAASLFGDRDFSLPRLQALLKGDLSHWFQLYCRLLLPPVMNAFWKHGLMFEPHLQNVLLVLENGLPRRIILRDLDNVKIVEGGPAWRAMAPSKDMTFHLDLAWRRFTYCLIVNHLSETIATLSFLEEGDEMSLWRILRETLNETDIPEPFKAGLLDGPVLWAKKNFFTRVTRRDDLQAPFAEIPNPMAGL